MSQIVETGTKSAIAGAAIVQHARVKLTAGKLAVAGLADKEVGTNLATTFADGDPATVRLTSAQGTTKMIADGAIAEGVKVYTAASGKISATNAATSYLVGIAWEVATADGDYIEVLRNSHGDTANV